MAITYTEKGHWLHEEIERQGHWLEQRDGVWVSSDDVAVQAIIDAFDPLPHAQREASERVDEAAGKARARYITWQPGQEAVYQLKREQAQAYKAAGYPADASPWPLIDAEAQARGISEQQVADEILAIADAWMQKAAQIEAIRMKAKADIKAATDWQSCLAIAEQAERDLEAV